MMFADKIAVPVILFLSLFLFFLMLHISWLKWADVVIDFGRELYIPWQIGNGKVLYKDMYYLYGPLAAYWNAFLFHCLGGRAGSILGFNFILLCYLIWVIFKYFGYLASQLTAALAVFSFVSFFALAHYSIIGNYNYICPYSMALVYGLALALTVFMLICHTTWRRKSVGMFLIGVLSGLVLLTRIEIAFAFLGAFVLSIPLRGVVGLPVKIAWRSLSLTLGGFVLPIALAIFFFAFKLGGSEGLSALASPLKAALSSGVVSNPFVTGMSGFDDVASSFFNMGKVLLVYFLVCVTALLAALIVNLLGTELLRRVGRLFFMSSLLLGLYLYSGRIDWNIVFLPLPIFCIIFILLSCWMLRMQRVVSHGCYIRVSFGLFSLFLLLKIFLKAHIYHYGFVLALPAFMVTLILFIHDIPENLPAEKFDRRTFQLIMVGMLIVVACVHLGFSYKLLSLKNYPVGTDVGVFKTYDKNYSAMGPVLQATLAYLKTNLRQDETLAVFPEGVMLNFLLKKSNPTPYYDLIPTTVALYSEERILNSYRSASPDYVVVLERDMSEYGPRYFGRDYALQIFDWVRNNYKVVFRAGAWPGDGKGFGAVVLKRTVY